MYGEVNGFFQISPCWSWRTVWDEKRRWVGYAIVDIDRKRQVRSGMLWEFVSLVPRCLMPAVVKFEGHHNFEVLQGIHRLMFALPWQTVHSLQFHKGDLGNDWIWAQHWLICWSLYLRRWLPVIDTPIRAWRCIFNVVNGNAWKSREHVLYFVPPSKCQFSANDWDAV